jgi:tRNA-Thr(GGU) m(6)t(6)A37 methyltransferase TsaA
MASMTSIAIRVIHTPFRQVKGAPIQPVFAPAAEGTVELLPEYADGLTDLAGFERVWLVYWLDRTGPARLRVIPFRDTIDHGIFATRAPCRPNPIGLSCVRLIAVAGNVLTVADVDMLDGTPLLDIKPYVPQFDAFPSVRAGWLDSSQNNTHADGRFVGPQ